MEFKIIIDAVSQALNEKSGDDENSLRQVEHILDNKGKSVSTKVQLRPILDKDEKIEKMQSKNIFSKN